MADGAAEPADARDARIAELERELAGVLATNAQLLAAVESVQSGIGIFDADDRMVYRNQQYHDLMAPSVRAVMAPGKRFDEMIREAEAIAPVYHPEMGADFLPRRLALHGADAADHEHRLADGRWLRVRESVMPDGGRVVLVHDITDRKRTEQRLKESEQRFRVLTEAHPVPLVIVDIKRARVMYASPPLAEMLRVPADSLVGSSTLGFYTAREDRRRIVRKLREQGHLNGEEVRVRRGDGSTFLASFTSRLIAFEGREAMITGIHDLAERQRAEAADTLLKAVIDAVPATIHVKDSAFRYRLLNRYYLDQWHLDQEDAVGRTQREVFSDRLDYAWSDATDGRDAWVVANRRATGFYEVTTPTADGDMVLWANKTPLFDEAGEVAHIVTVGMDITELKRAEAEIARQRETLHQNEKLTALGSLLAGVAHELNNPLSVVVAHATMLRDFATDPRIRDRALKIHAAAERCARIVRTFLAMARSKPRERGPVDLNAVLEAVLEIVAYNLRTTDVTVVRKLAPDLPPVWGDEDQLSQVFMNLIVNAEQALQAVPTPRRLTVQSKREARAVRVAITDNGPGIAPELSKRIFDPFFTTKPVGGGTGVGLSVCHGIVSAHDGRILVKSRPGEGATFVVRLPAAEGAARGAPPVEALNGSRHGRVLVVDDEGEVRGLLAEILQRDGHSVAVAASGREALELLSGRGFDLIVSDVRMPDMDGPTLYKALAAGRPEMLARLVFVTGAGLAADVAGFLAETGAPVIEKPLDAYDVRRRVMQQLAAAV